MFKEFNLSNGKKIKINLNNVMSVTYNTAINDRVYIGVYYVDGTHDEFHGLDAEVIWQGIG